MTKINSIGFLFKLFYLFHHSSLSHPAIFMCFFFHFDDVFIERNSAHCNLLRIISFSMVIYFDLKIIHVMVCSAFIWLLPLLFFVFMWKHVSFIHSLKWNCSITCLSFYWSIIQLNGLKCLLYTLHSIVCFLSWFVSFMRLPAWIEQFLQTKCWITWNFH